MLPKIRLHPLFALLVIFASFVDHLFEMVTLFTIVLLHELGHWAAARYFEWEIKEITLLPFGAVMRVTEGEAKPMKEGLIVALSGPAMNGLLLLYAWLMGELGWWSRDWTIFFMLSNLLVGGVNLLPIYPLDGSRIYFSLRAWFLPYWKLLRERVILSLCFILGWFLLAWVLFPLALGWLVVQGFLLQQSWLKWRQQPYDFLRFLLQRPRSHGQITYHVEALTGEETVWQVLQSLRLYRFHLFYLRGKKAELVAESTFLDAYLKYQQSERAAQEFFR